MPLDFSKEQPPPSLGKPKTRKEAERRIKIAKKKAKERLREIDEEVKYKLLRDTILRNDDYERMVRDGQAQLVAQFGALPPGWEYVTTPEVVAVFTGWDDKNSAQIIGKIPIVSFTRNREQFALQITIRDRDNREVVLRIPDELRKAGTFQDEVDRVVYETNAAIKQLSTGALPSQPALTCLNLDSLGRTEIARTTLRDWLAYRKLYEGMWADEHRPQQQGGEEPRETS
jgi:hypothetical protein